MNKYQSNTVAAVRDLTRYILLTHAWIVAIKLRTKFILLRSKLCNTIWRLSDEKSKV